MKLLSKHKATIVTVAIALAILVGLVVMIPATPQNAISVDGIEPSGSRIDFPAEPITLTYWRTVDGTTPFNDIIKDYNKLHPNVTIKLSNLPYGDYDKQLTEAAKSGTLPDLYSIKEDWMPRYKDYHQPAPDTVYSAQEFKNTFVDVVSRRLVSGQLVDGLAYGVSTLGLFYNTDMLSSVGVSSPPTTWQELMDLNHKLTMRTGNDIAQAGVALGNVNVTDYTAITSVLMQQNGATMTNTPPTQATFNKPDSSGYASAAKAMSFYSSFAKPSNANYSWNDKLGSSLDAFKAGKLAMMINYAYRAPEIDAANPSLHYKMAALPQVSSAKPTNGAEFWVEQASKTSKNTEVAWDFLRFAATRTQLNRYSIATYRPAARKDLVAQQSQDKYLGPFAKQISSAKTWYKGNSYNVDGIFGDMIGAVLGGGDAQSAVDTAAMRTTQEIIRSE